MAYRPKCNPPPSFALPCVQLSGRSWPSSWPSDRTNKRQTDRQRSAAHARWVQGTAAPAACCSTLTPAWRRMSCKPQVHRQQHRLPAVHICAHSLLRHRPLLQAAPALDTDPKTQLERDRLARVAANTQKMAAFMAGAAAGPPPPPPPAQAPHASPTGAAAAAAAGEPVTPGQGDDRAPVVGGKRPAPDAMAGGRGGRGGAKSRRG